MLVVAPPVNEAFQEHMAICLALRLPFFVVVTKVDLGYFDPHETFNQLHNVARSQGCNKTFVLHNNNNNGSTSADLDNIPVFALSCVTGEGINELTRFIRDLAPIESAPPNSDPDSCLFQIDETFRYEHFLKSNFMMFAEIIVQSKE